MYTLGKPPYWAQKPQASVTPNASSAFRNWVGSTESSSVMTAPKKTQILPKVLGIAQEESSHLAVDLDAMMAGGGKTNAMSRLNKASKSKSNARRNRPEVGPHMPAATGGHSQNYFDPSVTSAGHLCNITESSHSGDQTSKDIAHLQGGESKSIRVARRRTTTSTSANAGGASTENNFVGNKPVRHLVGLPQALGSSGPGKVEGSVKAAERHSPSSLETNYHSAEDLKEQRRRCDAFKRRNHEKWVEHEKTKQRWQQSAKHSVAILVNEAWRLEKLHLNHQKIHCEKLLRKQKADIKGGKGASSMFNWKVHGVGIVRMYPLVPAHAACDESTVSHAGLGFGLEKSLSPALVWSPETRLLNRDSEEESSEDGE